MWGITSTIFYTPEYKHISNVNGAETADVFSQKALFAVAAASVWAGKEGARGRHVYTLNDDLPFSFLMADPKESHLLTNLNGSPVVGSVTYAARAPPPAGTNACNHHVSWNSSARKVQPQISSSRLKAIMKRSQKRAKKKQKKIDLIRLAGHTQVVYTTGS